MDWKRILIGGILAGIALNITEFVFHGLIMSGTYAKYPEAFSQEPANPLYFLVVAICIAFAAALLFSKSRACWGEGAKGGATFGFFVGLIAFFTFFYDPLVISGYPYYLAWCQGSITVIALVVTGTVLGLVIKKS